MAGAHRKVTRKMEEEKTGVDRAMAKLSLG